jgi:hypothetical protein
VAVHQVNIENIIVLEPKHDAPITADADAPVSLQIALQRMQAISGKVNVRRTHSRVEMGQHVSNALELIRPDLSCVPVLKQAPQASMAECPNHHVIVPCIGTGIKTNSGWPLLQFDVTRSPALLLLAASVCLAADLKPEAAQAFDRYTRETEARLASRKAFLWADGSAEHLRQVQQGQVLVEPWNGKPDISVPGALIHDWIGAIFIPGANLEKTLAVMQDYDHHKAVYHDVLDSKLLGQKGNDFKFYRLRQLKKGVINGEYHTEFDAHYERLNDAQWLCQSRSTLIAELENPGKPNQHELPPGHDDGYLWRLNGYWRLEQRDGGVYLECEAVSLTRSLPAIVGALFAPAMRGLESETMTATLQSTRDAVKK